MKKMPDEQSKPNALKPSADASATSAHAKKKNSKISEKEKRTRVLLIAVLSLVILSIASLCLWIYNYSHFEMFGQMTDISAEELNFRGREISSLDALTDYLHKFKSLKRVNLGSFEIEAEDAFLLRQAFPGVEFSYHPVLNIEGKNYDTDISSLNLSDHGFTDLNVFMQKLDYLSDLKSVVFGNNSIPQSEKELLCSAYPDISFEVLGTYEIYGKTVLENVEELDLRDVKLDASLVDQLSLLSQLRYVDLHDQPLSIDDKITLAEMLPEVNFGWEVKYNGELYDSTISEWDLSGTKLTTDDLDELKRAVSQFPKLEKLILCDCGLSNETLQDLQNELENVKVVWRIYLGSRWSLRTDAVAFSVLIIHYDYPRMTSESIQVLKYCTDLRALDLGHQAISDLSVIGDYLPELRLLILADNQIRDVSPLAKLKHLHYLELFVNKISDISPLKQLHELVDVNISYNGGLYDIEPLLYSPMMERVWLESTSVGGNGFAVLEETYPKAKIVRYGSGSVDQGWRWGHPRYEQMMDMWFNDYYGDEFSKFDDKAKELGLT
ncbi:MAG: leucine-rich repeat domain-containing protein [Oscillospiraceae bacterium]|nr:leucine-rich repeat domain-containing protein [Oscillospiraceae bacterium]